jgi:putative membrane protein
MQQLEGKPDAPGLTERLAVERTLLATDRTLLAWVRTSLSLIAFGFTIFQVLQYIYERGGTRFMRQQTPRTIGMLMLASGTAPLLFAMLQYARTSKRMGRNERILLNPQFLTAGIVFLLGTVLLLTLLVRITLL